MCNSKTRKKSSLEILGCGVGGAGVGVGDIFQSDLVHN